MGRWIDPSRERRAKGAFVGISAKHSKHLVRVTKFILDRGFVPLHPTLRSEFKFGTEITAKEAEKYKDYFMRNCEEMWVFGPLTKSVFDDIRIAKRLGKPVRYFDISNLSGIKEIPKEEVDVSDLT